MNKKLEKIKEQLEEEMKQEAEQIRAILRNSYSPSLDLFTRYAEGSPIEKLIMVGAMTAILEIDNEKEPASGSETAVH